MIPRLEIKFPLCLQRRFLFGKSPGQYSGEFLLNHGRSGLMLALQSAGITPGASVGVMAYNCHTVMNAVECAGCRPVFIDVTDDLTLDFEDLGRKVSGMSAMVVTHLFGIVNDVKRIREAYPDLIIIEDCAHAYGLKELYGDFAVFSIGQGKMPSIGDGGILRVLNSKYMECAKVLYGELPDYSKMQSAMLFVRLWAKSLMHSRLVYGWLTLPMKRKRGVVSGRESVIPMKMCRGIEAVYDSVKGKVDAQIITRKRNAQFMLSIMPNDEVKQSYLGSNAFMLVVRCEHPDRLQLLLEQRGIDSATHFANSIRWAAEFGYEKGQCPNAEKLITQLLMIPIYCV